MLAHRRVTEAILTGRETLHYVAVPSLLVTGSEISAIYHSPIDNTESGEAKCPCWYIRSQFVNVARPENCL